VIQRSHSELKSRPKLNPTGLGRAGTLASTLAVNHVFVLAHVKNPDLTAETDKGRLSRSPAAWFRRDVILILGRMFFLRPAFVRLCRPSNSVIDMS
jgi:hypothetical protein